MSTATTGEDGTPQVDLDAKMEETQSSVAEEDMHVKTGSAPVTSTATATETDASTIKIDSSKLPTENQTGKSETVSSPPVKSEDVAKDNAKEQPTEVVVADHFGALKKEDPDEAGKSQGSNNPTFDGKKGEEVQEPTDVNTNTTPAKVYDIDLKPEYILNSRHACLEEEEKYTPGLGEDEQHPNQKGKRNRHKKNVKNSMKRGLEDTLSDMKMCKATMMGEECKFGDTCKFSHDMKAMLSMREDDIKEVEGGCPHYQIYGKCPYGIACRVGGSHLNLATGVNFVKEECIRCDKNIFVKNALPYSTTVLLRKRKYKFVCKRLDKFAKKKNWNVSKDDENEGEGGGKGKVEGGEKANEGAMDLTPLPKTRKLIDFSNKVYVAPLTTVGNLPFRRIMKKHGADITCGEMAVATSLLQGRVGEWTLLKRHADEDIFGVQIAAAHADVYTRLSEVIENEKLEIDFLDMNLGCPIDAICKTGAGAKLMLRENAIRESVLGMAKNLGCPITIKIRTGWDQKKPFAHKLVPKIQQWGLGSVGAIMMHGRSRLQRYSNLADWDYISMASQEQSSEIETIPLIGNGDIFSYADYEEKVLKHEGLSPTAMIGRGALIKPWLPTEIKEKRHWDISASERLDILKDFVRFGLEHWGSDTYGVNNTRRFLLEWMSFLCRYVPVGLLEAQSVPQQMHQRPPRHMCGRSDLETMMMSMNSADWVKISEMLLGPVREGFKFEPKHKAKGYK
uniref:tRNA-dihydrouridine(47) synthase [NAD(P)(+)] n=1 Tax=Chaetoceros debilis TaxID=122233 RepID=A0A7S3Q1V7_9STRA